MPQPTDATAQVTIHKNLHNAVFDVKSMFGAAGDGVTDDTTAFTNAANAAGVGGTVLIPQGTYILNDWAPAQQVHLQGAGMPSPGGSGGTTLKAKAGATWVVKLLGFYNPSVRDLQINGNTRASSGVLVQGQGSSSTSQGALFENVEFYRCLNAVKLDAASFQTDKNTFIRCRVDESTTGIWCNGSNTQFTVFVQVVIGADIGVRMSGGTLTWIGGGCGSSAGASTQGIWIDNVNCKYISLVDVINEYGNAAIDIDGTTAWPVQGVSADHCVLTGSTANVKIGTNSGHFYARQTAFNVGNVIAVANDTLFKDDNCSFLSGAAWSQTGSSNRRIQTDINGTHFYFNSTTAKSHAYVTGEFEGTGLGTLAKAGIPADGDFIFPVSGLIAVDTTNSRIYVRVGSTWKYAALT